MRKLAICAALAAAFAPGLASATDGYFADGYGIKAKGRAGTGTAMASDAFGGANNPAAMVFVGDRIDFGVDLFSPKRSASRSGSSPLLGPIDGSADSDSDYFLIPEFGYNKMINPNMSLGVTVYGNGGMNTNYPGGQIPAASACAGFATPLPNAGPYNLLCGTGKLGVDLAQLVIAPTFAYKLTPSQGIGISPLFGVQRFKAEGLQGFARVLDFTHECHQQRIRHGLRVGRQDRVVRAVERHGHGRRGVLDQDLHVQVQRLQGALRRGGRFRHARELQRRALHSRRRPSSRSSPITGASTTTTFPRWATRARTFSSARAAT